MTDSPQRSETTNSTQIVVTSTTETDQILDDQIDLDKPENSAKPPKISSTKDSAMEDSTILGADIPTTQTQPIAPTTADATEKFTMSLKTEIPPGFISSDQQLSVKDKDFTALTTDQVQSSMSVDSIFTKTTDFK